MLEAINDRVSEIPAQEKFLKNRCNKDHPNDILDDHHAQHYNT